MQQAVAPPAPTEELQCKPVKVVDGRDVIDMSGVNVDIYTLLGIGPEPGTADAGTSDSGTLMSWGRWVTMFIGIMAGLLIMDLLFNYIFWKRYFTGDRVATWEPIKVWLFLIIAMSCARILG